MCTIRYERYLNHGHRGPRLKKEPLTRTLLHFFFFFFVLPGQILLSNMVFFGLSKNYLRNSIGQDRHKYSIENENCTSSEVLDRFANVIRA